MSTTSPHEWLRRVSDYHTGGVDAAEVEAVESHLATCEDCRQALAVFRRFYALASSPLRLGEPSSVVAEQLALRKDRASDLIGSDALEDRPNPRGSRRSVGNRRLMGLASVLAASLVIVGFFTVLGPRIGEGSRIGGAGKHVRSTLQPNQTSDVPITPVATPGAQSKFVTNILTAKGVSPTFVPIDVTSHFTVGDTVDVICLVRGVSGSQKHILSVHWFFNGTDMQIPQIQGTTTEPVTKDAYVYFSLTYPSVGIGMAEIFLDLPSTDPGDQANDPYLAGKISFAIEPADTGAGTASATRSALPTSLVRAPSTTTWVALR